MIMLVLFRDISTGASSALNMVTQIKESLDKLRIERRETDIVMIENTCNTTTTSEVQVCKKMKELFSIIRNSVQDKEEHKH